MPIDPRSLKRDSRIGEYVVRERIAIGGMAAVYRVRRGRRNLALKLTLEARSELDDTAWITLRDRVNREASIIFGSRHPNIVRGFALDRWPNMDTGYLYIVTEYVPGERLYAWQAKESASLGRIVSVFIKLADALRDLHSRRTYHRDLKSENIVVAANDEPVLIDFGVSRSVGAFPMTHGLAIIGTASHLSARYAHAVLNAHETFETFRYRASDDLHAVGYMLYEVLTGEPPFGGPFQDESFALRRILETVQTPAHLKNPAVPEVLSAIVERLLAKDERKGFRSAGALIKALDRALASADARWDEPFVALGRDPARVDEERPTEAPAPLRRRVPKVRPA